MKPKEKAKELFDNLFLLHNSSTDENGNFFIVALNKDLAKQCALIAVDEIIKLSSKSVGNIHQQRAINNINNYWQEVKQEIEKL